MWKKKKFNVGVCLLALLALSGCQMYEPDVKQTQEFDSSIPEEFIDSANEELVVDLDWWKEFGDEQLEAFIKEALENNPSIAEIYTRLNRAESEAKITKTQLLPTLDASAKAGTGREFIDGSSAGYEVYGVSLTAGYEFDLWGRVNSDIQASESDVLSAKMDVQTAVSTLISNIVIAWVQIQSQMQYRDVLKAQLEVNKQALESMIYRFSQGKSDTILDVLQQRQTLNSTKNAIPLSEQKEYIYRSTLSLLLGKPANTELDIKKVELKNPKDLPSKGIATQIFEGRPDLKSQRYKVMSAAWSLASARADLLPKIALSSSSPILSFDSFGFNQLFQAWTLQITGMISQPIFDGGLRLREIEVNQALTLEAFNAYKYAVLTALSEVQNAITNELTQDKYMKSLNQSYQDSLMMLNESKNGYINGKIDYLNVVSALTTAQSLELNMISAKMDLLLYRVSLYRTLGGAWISDVSDSLEDGYKKTLEDSNFAPLSAEVFGQY